MWLAKIWSLKIHSRTVVKKVVYKRIREKETQKVVNNLHSIIELALDRSYIHRILNDLLVGGKLFCIHRVHERQNLVVITQLGNQRDANAEIGFVGVCIAASSASGCGRAAGSRWRAGKLRRLDNQIGGGGSRGRSGFFRSLNCTTNLENYS